MQNDMETAVCIDFKRGSHGLVTQLAGRESQQVEMRRLVIQKKAIAPSQLSK